MKGNFWRNCAVKEGKSKAEGRICQRGDCRVRYFLTGFLVSFLCWKSGCRGVVDLKRKETVLPVSGKDNLLEKWRSIYSMVGRLRSVVINLM